MVRNFTDQRVMTDREYENTTNCNKNLLQLVKTYLIIYGILLFILILNECEIFTNLLSTR